MKNPLFDQMVADSSVDKLDFYHATEILRNNFMNRTDVPIEQVIQTLKVHMPFGYRAEHRLEYILKSLDPFFLQLEVNGLVSFRVIHPNPNSFYGQRAKDINEVIPTLAYYQAKAMEMGEYYNVTELTNSFHKVIRESEPNGKGISHARLRDAIPFLDNIGIYKAIGTKGYVFVRDKNVEVRDKYPATEKTVLLMCRKGVIPRK